MSTKQKNMERRTAAHKVMRASVIKRDGDDAARGIEGYAALFYDGTPETEYELWSGVRERIMPGAFDEALRLPDDVRGLINHDVNRLLGRTGSGTMRLQADKVGLHYDIDVPDTGDGRDIVELVERGDMSGSSFCFICTDERWYKVEDGEETIEIREILGCRLYDVGPVTFPAYDGTTAGTRDGDGDFSEARESHKRYRQGEGRRERKRRQMDMDVRVAEIQTEV